MFLPGRDRWPPPRGKLSLAMPADEAAPHPLPAMNGPNHT